VASDVEIDGVGNILVDVFFTGGFSDALSTLRDTKAKKKSLARHFLLASLHWCHGAQFLLCGILRAASFVRHRVRGFGVPVRVISSIASSHEIDPLDPTSRIHY
jgi:hypothetical protein